MTIDKTIPNYNIIAFGGRLQSGKSELASICMKYGYNKISFATPLKTLVRKLAKLNTIEELNELKNKPLGITMDGCAFDFLAYETGISEDICRDVCKQLSAESTGRDWLQIIGTNLIRANDADWHVRRTMRLMESGKKYVFDDVRFKNELEALKKANAELWFVVRPKVDNISHHASEESIFMQDFDYNIIVNDKSLAALTIRWDIYMQTRVEVYPYRRTLVEGILNSVDMDWDVAEKYFIYKDYRRVPYLFQYYCDYNHYLVNLDKDIKWTPNVENNGFIEVFLKGKENTCEFKEIVNPFDVEEIKKYYKETN